MKLKIIFLTCMVIIIMFIKTTFTYNGSRDFWTQQSIGSIFIPAVTAGVMSLTPGGFWAYPPFIIAQLVAMGTAGATGAVYNNPLFQSIFFKESSSKAPETNFLEQPIAIQQDSMVPPIDINKAPIPSTDKILNASPVDGPSNIIIALMMAAAAGAGYKLYRWYTAKKDEPIQRWIAQSQQKIVRDTKE